jgi:hypothetical protein
LLLLLLLIMSSTTQSTAASKDGIVKSPPPPPSEVTPLASAPAKATNDGKQQEEKPTPKIFALMRDGHEVIRGAQLDVGAAIEKEDYETAKDIWEKLCKWCNIHMIMEEGNDKGMGMFR